MRRALSVSATIVIAGLAISVALAQRPTSLLNPQPELALELPAADIATSDMAPSLANPLQARGRKRAVVQLQYVLEPFSEQERKQIHQWQELASRIKQTDDGEERKQLGGQLTELLQSIFDEDLARREQQLAELEARVQKLRDAVDGRRTHRDRIINVQVDSVMLDAEGLTIFGDYNLRPTVSGFKAPSPLQGEPAAFAPILSY